MLDVRKFLLEVKLRLHLAPETEREIVSELYSHYQDACSDYTSKGYTAEHAALAAINGLGRPRVVARRMYEAHSQGSWADAALSSAPHFLVCALIGTHSWHRTVPSLAVFGVIVVVTLGGWWYGKPNWLYTWAGYSLLPLTFGGIQSLRILRESVDSLSNGIFNAGTLAIIPAVLYFILSAGLVLKTASRVALRDWTLASSMLAPLPLVFLWLIVVARSGGLSPLDGTLAHQWDAPMSLLLGSLAAASALFIRIPQRLLKSVLYFAFSTVTALFLIHSVFDTAQFGVFCLTTLGVLLFLASPALFVLGRASAIRKRAESGEEPLSADFPGATT